jgi:hypothetical protein
MMHTPRLFELIIHFIHKHQWNWRGVAFCMERKF